MDAAGRTIFGQESHQISLLYYLTYASAAGGLEALISAKPDVGGQQYRVKASWMGWGMQREREREGEREKGVRKEEGWEGEGGREEESKRRGGKREQ